MFDENVFISWNFMVSHMSDMAIEPLVKYVTNNISLEAFVLLLLNPREIAIKFNHLCIVSEPYKCVYGITK